MGGDVRNLGVPNMDGFYGMVGALVGVALGNVIFGWFLYRR
jgi:hypothetical protein